MGAGIEIMQRSSTSLPRGVSKGCLEEGTDEELRVPPSVWWLVNSICQSETRVGGQEEWCGPDFELLLVGGCSLWLDMRN